MFSPKDNEKHLMSILNKVGISNGKLSSDTYEGFLKACQSYLEERKKRYLYLQINTVKAQEFLLSRLNTKNEKSNASEDISVANRT